MKIYSDPICSEIVKGRTVIMIAHRLNCMQFSDKVVVMNNGEIIQIGNHIELSLKNGNYKALLDRQKLLIHKALQDIKRN